MESNNESAMYELRLALYDMIKVTKGVIENRGTILHARKRIEAAEGILNKHFKITDVLRGEIPEKETQQGDKSQFIKDYKQYKENLKYLGGPTDWTEDKVNSLNKAAIFETIKGFNDLIGFFDSVLYAYEEGAEDWEERTLKAEADYSALKEKAEKMITCIVQLNDSIDKMWNECNMKSIPEKYKKEITAAQKECSKILAKWKEGEKEVQP